MIRGNKREGKSSMSEYTGTEKRRSSRAVSRIKAKVFDKDFEEDVAVRNVSYHGALLRIPQFVEIGRPLNLTMYLPDGVGPINVNGRVVWTETARSFFGFRSLNVGVEFSNMLYDQKQKLSEAMYYLLKKIRR